MCGQVENGLTAHSCILAEIMGYVKDGCFSATVRIVTLQSIAILCIKSLKYFNLCDKITFIGIAHGDTGMRAAEASRRLVLFLLLRGVLK